MRPYEKLGKTQQHVARSLVQHASWIDTEVRNEGCGWVWDTVSGTRRIMKALVTHGWAVEVETKPGCYHATDAAREFFQS